MAEMITMVVEEEDMAAAAALEVDMEVVTAAAAAVEEDMEVATAAVVAMGAAAAAAVVMAEVLALTVEPDKDGQAYSRTEEVAVDITTKSKNVSQCMKCAVFFVKCLVNISCYC